MNADAIPERALRVVSAVPGRIRLRAVDPGGRQRLASFAEEVGSWAEVTSVDLRARSGSIVVRFDPARANDVADRLLAFGVDAYAGSAGGPAGPAMTVGGAAASVNRAVGRRLDGTDLRVLVPLGLGLMAARRAVGGGERLAEAPWYLLAWYANETIWRFHGCNTTASGRVADSEGD